MIYLKKKIKKKIKIELQFLVRKKKQKKNNFITRTSSVILRFSIIENGELYVHNLLRI